MCTLIHVKPDVWPPSPFRERPFATARARTPASSSAFTVLSARRVYYISRGRRESCGSGHHRSTRGLVWHQRICHSARGSAHKSHGLLEDLERDKREVPSAHWAVNRPLSPIMFQSVGGCSPFPTGMPPRAPDSCSVNHSPLSVKASKRLRGTGRSWDFLAGKTGAASGATTMIASKW
jgi:hypothetical protein